VYDADYHGVSADFAKAADVEFLADAKGDKAQIYKYEEAPGFKDTAVDLPIATENPQHLERKGIEQHPAEHLAGHFGDVQRLGYPPAHVRPENEQPGGDHLQRSVVCGLEGCKHTLELPD